MSRNYNEKDETNEMEKNNGRAGSNSKHTGKSGRRRSKRPNSRGKSTNDPSWYNKNAVLVGNAASVDFNIPAGHYTDLHSEYIDGFSVPGLLALQVVPTIGKAETAQDAINRANTKLFLRLRGDKSGVAPYEPCDLGLMTMAFANIYSYIQWLKRLYCFVGMYSEMNKYMPKSLLYANFCDYNDFRIHRGEFRTGINELVNAVAQYSMPGSLPYFQRIKFLYSYLYTEGESVRDQLYMFIPSGFYQYAWKKEADDTRGQLLFKPFADEVIKRQRHLTVDDVLSYGWELIDAILNDSDISQMCADIARVIPDGELMKFEYLTESDVVLPQFDETVLHQIHNARVFNIDHTRLNIEQTTWETATGPVGILTQKVYAHFHESKSGGYHTALADHITADTLITAPRNNVTADDIMEYTRFIPCKRSLSDVSSETLRLACGADVITNMTVIKLDKDGEPTYHHVEGFMFVDTEAEAALSVMNGFKDLSDLRLFKYAPNNMLYFNSTVDNNYVEDAFFIGSLDNYTTLSRDRLIKLHEIAMLSMFTV